jgi:hypothetical protein
MFRARSVRGETMLQYLEAGPDVTSAHRKLQATIRRGLTKSVVRDIGYPAGREPEASVATDGRHWFWTRDHRGSDVFTKRRLNWFGVLNQSPGVSITVEVNTVYKGRNDNAAGFFARDSETGLIYFLHSGRVGGGTKGVGKNSFLTWAALHKHTLVDVVDSSGKIRRGLVVMPVNGATAVKAAIRYIDLVRGFKVAVREGKILTRKFRSQQQEFEDYFSEGRGRRKGRRTSEIDYVTRHGEIVDALEKWRSSRPMPSHSHIVKNTFIDLGVGNGKNLIEIFEVKPKADRPSIYSAVGQLLVHGRNETCHRTIVLPRDEVLASDLTDGLRRLGIEVIRFKLDENSATILGIR